MLAGGAGVTGAYFWKQGNLTRNYMHPLDDTWKGALRAIESLNLKIKAKRRDSHYGVIKAKLPSEETLKIAMERWTDRETKVTIRSGASGDREMSQRVHAQIEKAIRQRRF